MPMFKWPCKQNPVHLSSNAHLIVNVWQLNSLPLCGQQKIKIAKVLLSAHITYQRKRGFVFSLSPCLKSQKLIKLLNPLIWRTLSENFFPATINKSPHSPILCSCKLPIFFTYLSLYQYTDYASQVKENLKEQKLICIVVDLMFCNNFLVWKKMLIHWNKKGVHFGKWPNSKVLQMSGFKYLL